MDCSAITDADLETLRALNRDYIRSVQTSDVRRFAELLAPDFLCSNPDGSLVDRERFLKQTARPVAISNLGADDVNVRLFGDFAIVHVFFQAEDGIRDLTVTGVQTCALPICVIPTTLLHDAQRNKDVDISVEYPTRGGPFPVIIVSHTYGMSNRMYETLVANWTGQDRKSVV